MWAGRQEQVRSLAVLQRTQAQFPAPTWISNSSSRESNALSDLQGTKHIYGTQTHKIKIYESLRKYTGYQARAERLTEGLKLIG